MSAVQQLKAELHDQPVSPLRPEQITEYREELARVGAISSGRDMEGNPTHWVPGDRGQAHATARRISKVLQEQAPKRIDEPMRRDRVGKLAAEVLGEIKEAMLPQTVMRRNPAGAVDQFLRRENHPVVKDKILAWKRALRALDPDNTDRDYTNIEKYRPVGTPESTASFMGDAQIPGNFAMSARAKENWPLGEPTARTALREVQERDEAEALRARIAELEAQVAAPAARNGKAKKPDGRKRNYTPEQKQAMADRLARARAAKAAERAAAEPVGA